MPQSAQQSLGKLSGAANLKTKGPGVEDEPPLLYLGSQKDCQIQDLSFQVHLPLFYSTPRSTRGLSLLLSGAPRGPLWRTSVAWMLASTASPMLGCPVRHCLMITKGWRDSSVVKSACCLQRSQARIPAPCQVAHSCL